MKEGEMNMYRINIPEDANCIINTLHREGYSAYVVGGCVRDSLLGRAPEDWDITTDALPEAMVKIFGSEDFKVIETGLKHGTITILTNSIIFELTTFRIDGSYSDNRRPDNVTFIDSLREDLSRRDFTINAMAYNDDIGLVDYFNGISDLNNKIVRCVGNPDDRFNEDALRMLRAVRFSSQLCFELEPENLIASIRRNAALIKNISRERIRDEFSKILLSYIPSFGMIKLKESGLLEYILPEMVPSIGFEQNNIHHDKDVFGHSLAALDNTPARLDLRLSALLHDIGKPQSYTVDENNVGHFYGHHKISADMSRKILKRLRFDNKTIEKVSLLVYEHMSRFDKLREPNTKKFINKVGIQNLDDLFTLQIADVKASAGDFRDIKNVLKLKEKCDNIINEKYPLTIKDMAINGDDLKAMGITEGIEIGRTLKILLEIILEKPEYNNLEMLKEIVKNILKTN